MQEKACCSARQYLLLDDDAIIAQCEVDRFRSGGPGGQKRNKTSSGIRLRHRPTGLMVKATEDRSQQVNLRRAIRRLREAIALQVRAGILLDGYQKSDCLLSCMSRDGRLTVGRRDPRYTLVVADVLDVFAACDMRVRDAAKVLGISTGQLSQFFRRYPKLFRQVNQMRLSVGAKPLR